MSRRPRPHVSQETLHIAREYLEHRGYTVLDSNSRQSPVDLVAQVDDLFVFFTVKTLPDTRALSNYATDRQKVQIRKASARWLQAHPEITEPGGLRFDSIAVTTTDTGRVMRIDHIEGLY